jgi:cold shock CspA family protein
MGKSQETYNKKEKEKKRLKKREDKQQKAEERKANGSTGLDNMIAYVDEFGNITDTPPDPTKKKAKIDLDSIDISVRKQEHVEVDPIRKGKVDFFNSSKGFGFIKETESGERYFVHVSGILQPIVEGDAVTFEVERGPKGMTAVRVKKG